MTKVVCGKTVLVLKVAREAVGSVKRLVGFGAGGGHGQRCPRTATAPCCPYHQPPPLARRPTTALRPFAVPGPHWAVPGRQLQRDGLLPALPGLLSAGTRPLSRHFPARRPRPNCSTPSQVSSKGRKGPQPLHPKERPLEKGWLLKASGLRALTAVLLLETLWTFHQQK